MRLLRFRIREWDSKTVKGLLGPLFAIPVKGHGRPRRSRVSDSYSSPDNARRRHSMGAVARFATRVSAPGAQKGTAGRRLHRAECILSQSGLTVGQDRDPHSAIAAHPYKIVDEMLEPLGDVHQAGGRYPQGVVAGEGILPADCEGRSARGRESAGQCMEQIETPPGGRLPSRR
jgi:hypothetical protein